MAKLTYTNQPLDYIYLIAMMKSRGLAFKDEAKALEQLKIIGYFRLASYLRPMESDKVNHQYKPGSTFNVDVAAMGFPAGWENEPLWK